MGWRRKFFFNGLLTALFICLIRPEMVMAGDELDDLFDDDDFLEEEIVVNDPLEPVNRFFFAFNDKMYYWLIRPVAKGYSLIIPEDIRYGIDNAFHNIGMPVRLINNLLQGKFEAGGLEIGRFVINSTVGVAGLADPAAHEFGLAIVDEDLGQTLGKYGVGEGWYLCLPFLGPSTVRDGVGLAGDYMVSPLRFFLINEPSLGFGLWGWRVENSIAIHGDDYDDLHDQAFDPYVAFRDFYLQHRRALVADDLTVAGQEENNDEFACNRWQSTIGIPFNLAGARAIMACARQRGENVKLIRRRSGNRLLFRVERLAN